MSSLRAGAIASNGFGTGMAGEGLMNKPAVFEFTRLRPEFSFSCEALVLNTTAGANMRMLASDSPEAMAVSDAVVAAAAASRAPAESQRKSGGPTFVGFEEKAHAGVSLPVEGGATSARRFSSVAELASTDGFSGVGCLTGVVVRKVDAPHLRLPGVSSPALSIAARSGSPVNMRIYLGDPEESGAFHTLGRSAGVEAVLRVSVSGGALRDLLGNIPLEMLTLATGSEGGDVCDVGVHVASIARSLLDGFVAGGEQGERVDVVVACSACVDANGRVVSGGSSYRLVALHPNHPFGGVDVLAQLRKH